jgi:hypothetical protein
VPARAALKRAAETLTFYGPARRLSPMRIRIRGCRLASRWLLLGASTILALSKLHGVGSASADGVSPVVSSEIRRDVEEGRARVLPATHFSVIRQFDTAPVLALETDSEAAEGSRECGGARRASHAG